MQIQGKSPSSLSFSLNLLVELHSFTLQGKLFNNKFPWNTREFTPYLMGCNGGMFRIFPFLKSYVIGL